MHNPNLRPKRRTRNVALLAAILAITHSTAAPSGGSLASGGSTAKPISNEEYRRFALLHEGDPRLGKELFAQEQRVLCSKCHTVDGTAAKTGPDLFAIGDKFGRRDIIESILTPSATIAVGYETTLVETKSDEALTGVVKEATDAWLGLMGMDGRLMRIATADIAARRASETSFMPEGLQAGLTLEEFTDLIEYLVGLKQAESASMVAHGMPSEIRLLDRPVRFSPVHREELNFEHPVWFGPIPGQSNVFLVVEHESGKIWRLDLNVPGGSKSLFVDLERYLKGTRGLLGMVLHPAFRQNRKYYFEKHLVENGKFATFLFEREAAPDLRTDSGRPSRQIMRFDAATGVHYGGGLQFGPDGFLYAGMGDTGPQEDPQGHGQDGTLLIGKMLRIDVDHTERGLPYAVPPDNPFAGSTTMRPEIWALGLREPWRFSFDPVTGDLWAGDVGQDRYEEVDILRKGENYGWNVYEGFEPFSNRYRKEGENYIQPIFAYGRKFGVSVTGGFIYRADPNSSFYGVYIFGDFQSQRVWGLTQENRVLKTIRQIGTAPQRVVSFGRDENGALYVVGYEGTIYRLELEGAVFE